MITGTTMTRSETSRITFGPLRFFRPVCIRRREPSQQEVPEAAEAAEKQTMSPIDLKTLDPATVKAGEEFDVWIATEWMGWEKRDGYWWERGAKTPTHYLPGSDCDFRPSTNHAHAAEAMVKVYRSRMVVYDNFARCHVRPSVESHRWYTGDCPFTETNGNKLEAMALAICRAIAAVLVAVEKEEGGE